MQNGYSFKSNVKLNPMFMEWYKMWIMGLVVSSIHQQFLYQLPTLQIVPCSAALNVKSKQNKINNCCHWNVKRTMICQDLTSQSVDHVFHVSHVFLLPRHMGTGCPRKLTNLLSSIANVQAENVEGSQNWSEIGEFQILIYMKALHLSIFSF